MSYIFNNPDSASFEIDDDDDDDGASSTTVTTSSSATSGAEFNEQTWLLFWTIIVIVLVLFYFVRQYCYVRTGFDICHIRLSLQQRKRRREENGGGEMNEQEAADHLLAQELQRELAKEQFEQDRLATREERRVWYEYYLQPYSMVVKEGDLFYAQDKESTKATENNMDQEGEEIDGDDEDDDEDEDEDGPVIMVCQQPKTLVVGAATTSEENNDEEVGDVKQQTTTSASQPQFIPCSEHDDDAVLYLQLPAIDPISTPLNRVGSNSHLAKSYVQLQQQQEQERQQRHRDQQQQHRGSKPIDATCALCIDEYEVGDTIVWSHDTTKCSHVYHKDCLLEWLTKGKKHCPVCRSWFVPGSSIQNQKLAHGLAWKCALQEQQQLEKEMEHEREQQEKEEKEREQEEEKKKKRQLTTITTRTKHNDDDESQSSDDDDDDDDDDDQQQQQ